MKKEKYKGGITPLSFDDLVCITLQVQGASDEIKHSITISILHVVTTSHMQQAPDMFSSHKIIKRSKYIFNVGLIDDSGRQDSLR